MDNQFMRLSDRQSDLMAERMSEVSAIPGATIQLPLMANAHHGQVFELTTQMATDTIVQQLLTKYVGEDAGLIGLACANGVYRFFVVAKDDHDRIVKEVMGA